MSLEEHRVTFLALLGVLALITASPALSRVLVVPRTEFLSELWLLDANHGSEDYPFNVTRGAEYRVFLGIANHLRYAAYYRVAVKLRNSTQSAADSFNQTPSNLSPLHEIRAFVADEAMWETPLAFSFDYEYDENSSKVDVHIVTINSISLEVENLTITWDAEKNRILGNLFFELWIYVPSSESFQYHKRFVGLWLNMTV